MTITFTAFKRISIFTVCVLLPIVQMSLADTNSDGHGAYVCCNGKQKPKICLRGNTRAVMNTNNPRIRCLLIHERTHIADMRRTHGNFCVGKPKGHYRFDIVDKAELHWLECRAYKAQTRCLTQYKLYHDAKVITDYAVTTYQCDPLQDGWVNPIYLQTLKQETDPWND